MGGILDVFTIIESLILDDCCKEFYCSVVIWLSLSG